MKDAAAGDAAAQFAIGTSYNEGLGVVANASLAFMWFRRAADAGDRDAQNNVGVFYKKGTGVARNVSAAVELFRRAAHAGSPLAMLNAAELLCRGVRGVDGVAANATEATDWFFIASATFAADGDIANKNLADEGLVRISYRRSDARRRAMKEDQRAESAFGGTSGL